MSTLKVKLFKPDAIVPTKGSELAAGWDLYSYHDGTISEKSQTTFETQIGIEIPPSTYGRIAPRSGLAFKHCINVHAGVIDRDYRNSLKIILFNHSDKDYYVKKGDRIAQLILEKYDPTNKIEIVNELSSTTRGIDGLGSTGK